MYEHGNGVVQDLAQAEKWYTKAAERGQTMAQYNLGLFYMTQKKHREAYEWFLRAAKQGHKLAEYNLARLYLHGHCMEVNYGEAYRWLAAAHQEDSWSAKALETCKQHLSEKEMEQLQSVAKVEGTQ
jgi:TPR repeat protein